MAEKLREQHALYYNENHRIPRRRSATYEDANARQTGSGVPTSTQDTDEHSMVSSTPRSVMRHRPIGALYVIPFTDGTEMHVTQRELGNLPENYQHAATLVIPQAAAPRTKRQPHPKVPVPSNAVYEMPPARNRPGKTDALPQQQERRRFHWLFWIGATGVLMFLGWIAISAFGTWWSIRVDDWQYGRPRTSQADANVGHGTAHNPDSHFIAQNLNRRIMVIEEPGDDPGKSKIYVGPTLIGKGQELTPVTLSFEDVNNDGRADLVLHLGDGKVVFLNQKDGTFTPAPTQ